MLYSLVHRVADTSQSGKGALEICLEEVDKAHGWFVVLLGQRYGWIPDEYKISDNPKYQYVCRRAAREETLSAVCCRWIKNVEKGKSITELEIMHGVLNQKGPVHAIALFRDPAFLDVGTACSPACVL